MNILGIGLDYLMLKNDKVRGDVRERQLDYAKCLNSFNLVIYSPKNLGLRAEKWSENLIVFPTNSDNKATFILGALKISSRICRKELINAITTEDPFTTGLVGYLLKKIFKIPLNVQTHVDFIDNRYWLSIRKINRLFNILGKFILKRADTIRVGTNTEKKKIAQLGISENKIFVIPVNSDLRKFNNINGNQIRERYLDGRFDRIALFSGRLVAQKDIPTLLKAFQIVLDKRPSTLLLILGKGQQESCLRDLSRSLRISSNVIFTGSIAHDQIPEYLAAADIYTISSIFEGTCIAMAEAMASGKPVVATRFAGTEDLIINSKNGFIIEQKDYKTFAEKILFLLNNPNIAKDMGKKGMLRVSDFFENNKNIDMVIKLWEQTAKIKL